MSLTLYGAGYAQIQPCSLKAYASPGHRAMRYRARSDTASDANEIQEDRRADVIAQRASHAQRCGRSVA